MKSAVQPFAALALLTGSTNAFWRMSCSSITLGRIDPIVNLKVSAPHSHTVGGGSAFDEASTYDTLRKSKCTSCQFGDDKSAYWTPSLHFVHEDGKVEIVPQVGGVLAYYLLLGENIKAFPKGFQVVAGDVNERNFTLPVPDPPLASWTAADKTQHALGQKAVGWNCLNYNKAPEGSRFRHGLPTQKFMDDNCVDGMRAEMMFPSCWNGNVTAKDHKSHVAYPSLIDGGECPPGFPVRLPTLFYETIWNTYAFKGKTGRFTLSNGDCTGYSYHADFINGWDISTLQSAVDTCTNLSGRVEDCPIFAKDLQPESKRVQCKVEKFPAFLDDDDCAGPSNGLCGNVVVGGQPVVKPSASSAPPVPLSTVAPDVEPPATVPDVTATAYPTIDVFSSSSIVTPVVVATIPPAASSVAPSSPSSIPPVVTPIPEPKPKDGDKDKNNHDAIISTTTYVKDNVEYNVCIKQVQVTVTATAPPPNEAEVTPAAHYRRHAHRHHRDPALGVH